MKAYNDQYRINKAIKRGFVIVLIAAIIAGYSFTISNTEVRQTSSEFSPVAYIIQLSPENATLAADYDNIMRKNIYGICWEGKNEDNLRFAKQMGYTHIMYQSGMHNSDQATNMSFLLQKPENLITSHLGIKQAITLASTYTIEEQEIFKSYYALKNLTSPFPHMLGNGWYTFNSLKKPLTFAVVQDWQQRRLVNLGVERAIAEVQRVERPEKGFLFGGLAWDEADLTGDFSSDTLALNGKNAAVTLAYWTGGDSSRLYPGTSHEYSTHSDGKAAFYKELKSAFRDRYPDRKLIYLWEPYRINGDLINQVLQRADKSELLSDLMLVSEGEGNQLTQFADDASLFASGLIKRDWVGSTVPNEHDFIKIKEIVGKAGIHGSWFGWFGRFNEPGEPMDNIYEVPRWEQLARVIPSWDNLCGVPLNERSWNNSEYRSSNSCMNDQVLYSRQPKTNKLFVVFMDPSATIPLKQGERVLSVSRVDSLFCEKRNAISELKITNNIISLAINSAKTAKSGSYSVFPNPARDFITLKSDNPGKPTFCQIIDNTGRPFKSFYIEGPENEISIEKLNCGGYYVHLSQDNNSVGSFKFIKVKN